MPSEGQDAPPKVPALTFGIAGHVDHGKTALVRALTGLETDRLSEEKRRGISIELGFAHLDLEVEGAPLRVGIVDMPGHERFVRRMIAGTAGVDAVVMVVAADEGVMPQGREHAAICGLLGLRRGVIVVTKVDLADADLLELAEDDIRGEFDGTFLADAPILRFSSRDPAPWRDGLLAGLAELAAQCMAARLERKADARPFRLPVDRSFTMKGRGTVVTGTAATGAIGLGDALRVWPGSKVVRVRTIERHGAEANAFAAPGRVALNLAGASVVEVPVGAVLAPPGAIVTTLRVDVQVTALAHLKAPLKARQRCLVHIGTTHVQAALTQLSGAPLAPGDTGFAQLHFERELAIAPGERFVARGTRLDPRFGQTIAGGLVLHPRPQRHKLGDADVAAALGMIAGDTLADRLRGLLLIAGVRGASEDELARMDRGAGGRIGKALEQLAASGHMRRLGADRRCFASVAVIELERRASAIVEAEHKAHPSRRGIDTDELMRRLGEWLDGDALADLLRKMTRKELLIAHGSTIAVPGFQPTLAQARDGVVDAAVVAVQRHDLATPTPAALLAELGVPGATLAELQLALAAGCERGDLLRVAEGYYVARDRLDRATAELFARHGADDTFSTGDLKAIVGLTRKHLIPLAEFLDGQRVTVRDPSGNRRFRTRAREALAAGVSALG